MTVSRSNPSSDRHIASVTGVIGESIGELILTFLAPPVSSASKRKLARSSARYTQAPTNRPTKCRPLTLLLASLGKIMLQSTCRRYRFSLDLHILTKT
jgi:hypothetical protein